MAPPRHTLLIVDDEPDVLDSLRHLFHRQYRVLTAPGGPEGLELLARDEVHLILSDQRMPGMTGDRFLARARQDYPEAIRLLFTGFADIQAVVHAINEGGIYRYIVKPWNVEELESILRQATAQYDLLAERRRLLAELQAANVQLSEANRELAEQSELKSAFLEVASHELNTPITIVQGMSELLKLMNPQRPESEREVVDQLADASRHLARLVSTMLKLVQSGEFRQGLRPRDVDLAAFLREVAEGLRPFASARSLDFGLELADDLGRFSIDPDKLRDAVTNLLTNAIKFTPDRGRISLRARLNGPDMAEIVVADEGIGLDEKELAHLFEPFFTEFDPRHHSTGDFGFNKRGLGLGLSLVKRFIDLHGGTVSASSRPGSGTAVTILLPRCSGPEAAGGSQSNHPAPSDGGPGDAPE